ncbi:MAG: hypothetical protein K9J13_12015 [Saprospiraceae bacterium]|nr:hypothetical protein [Saprospiraceae bacterium]
MRYFFIHIITFISIFGYSQSDSSRLIYFDYGGWGDTCVAFLTIDVVQIDSTSGRYIPLKNSKIIIANENKELKEYILQNNNRKTISFSWGWYEIEIKAEGYQTLKIIDYKSRPDQFSRTKICLVTGQGIVSVSSNPWPDPIPKNGIDTTFYTSREIDCIKEWRNDTLYQCTCWYKSGQLRYEMRKLSDSTQMSHSYYKSGQLYHIGFSNNQLTIGFVKEYYEDGRLKEELLNSETGQLVWTRIDSTGEYIVKYGNSVKSHPKYRENQCMFGYYKNGKKHGKWICRDIDGKRQRKYKYKHGKILLFITYGSDDRLPSRIRYKNSKRIVNSRK